MPPFVLHLFSFALAIGLSGGASAVLAQAALEAADADLAIGEWRSHLPAQYATDVAACADFTAYATQGGTVVLRYRDNGELRELNKVNALSQVDVAAVACNPFSEGQLLVLYRDGAFDVLADERVRLRSTAIADAEIDGERTVRGVTFVDATTAIVFADFGFVFFDLERGVFLDDVRWPTPVTDVQLLGGDLYVASESGLSVLPDYRRQPLLRDLSLYVDLLATELFDPAFRDTVTARVVSLAVLGGELYAGFGERVSGDTSYGGAVVAIAPTRDAYRVATGGGGFELMDLTSDGELLVATFRRRADGTGGDFVEVSSDGVDWRRLETSRVGLPFSAVPTPDGGVAFAARVRTGLCRVPSLEADGECTELNTPYETDVYDIEIDAAGRLAVASGRLSPQRGSAGTANGFYVREADGRWVNYNRNNTAALNDVERVPEDTFRTSIKDVVDVAWSPGGQEIYAAGYEEALARVAADGSRAGERIDQLNSSLQVSAGATNLVRTGGLAFTTDAFTGDTLLWVSNPEAGRPLSVRTSSGTWRSFDPDCGGSDFFTIVHDDTRDLLWIIDKGSGLVAYDPGADPLDEGDDRCRFFTVADGLPSGDVRSVVVDRRGTVYVGTTDGTASWTGGDPFDGSSDFTQPTVVVDGIRGQAFDGAVVGAIAVDGGNRKWVGNNSGLFLVSDNTTEQFARYTVDNSPLPSDRIDALAFDDATGVLWVGTPAGLMSLQTESSGGRELAHGVVEVYPQPVAPDYEGPIAIRGLALDANVKITDAAGRLVYETTAIGGTATWDGRDYTGRRAASGVYFVWATAARALEQPAGVVAKIALVR